MATNLYCVNTSNDELWIIDVDDPSASTQIGSFSAPNLSIGIPIALGALGTSLYALNNERGLWQINVNDLTNSVFLGYVIARVEPAVFVTPHAMAGHDGNLYISGQDGNLVRVDIGTPEDSVILGDIPSAQTRTLCSHDGSLFYISTTDELYEVNIDNPDQSVLYGQFPVELTNVRATGSLDGTMYGISFTSDDLWSINVADPSASTLIGSLPASLDRPHGMTAYEPPVVVNISLAATTGVPSVRLNTNNPGLGLSAESGSGLADFSLHAPNIGLSRVSGQPEVSLYLRSLGFSFSPSLGPPGFQFGLIPGNQIRVAASTGLPATSLRIAKLVSRSGLGVTENTFSVITTQDKVSIFNSNGDILFEFDLDASNSDPVDLQQMEDTDGWWVLDGAGRVYAYDAFGTYQDSTSFDLAVANPTGLTLLNDQLWIHASGTFYSHDLAGNRQQSDDFTADTQNANTTTLGNDGIHILALDATDQRVYSYVPESGRVENSELDYSSDNLIGVNGVGFSNGTYYLASSIGLRAYEYPTSGVSDDVDWDQVTELVFSQRDADGLDRSRVFESPDFDTGNLVIALRRNNSETDGSDYDQVAFQQSSAIVKNSDDTYTIPVQRSDLAEDFDHGMPEEIDPPLDGDYDVLLLLPDLPGINDFPSSRRSGWFWRFIPAALAAELEQLSEANPFHVWPARAVEQANIATPGENTIGDVVTLYRGEFTGSRSWDGRNWIPVNQFIDGNLLVHGTVTADAIAANSITAEAIAAGIISADKIAAGVIPDVSQFITEWGPITGGDIANSLIITRMIAEGNVTTSLIADASIIADKIASNAIVARTIAAGAVTAGAIAAGVITADKIAAGVIPDTSQFITEWGPITALDIANGLIVSRMIGAGQITESLIADASIITDKIAANAVVASKIAAGAVTADAIAARVITSEKLAVGVIPDTSQFLTGITAGDIANGLIVSRMIAGGQITESLLADASVVTDKLAAGAVLSEKIAAGAITTELLAANAVTAEKIAAMAISVDNLANGTFSEGGEEFSLSVPGRDFRGHSIVGYFEGGVGVLGRGNIGIAGISNNGSEAGVFNRETSSGTQSVELSDNQGHLIQASYNGVKFHVTNDGDILAGGDITATGTITGAEVTATSDLRYKSNLEKICGALEKLEKISGYTYEMSSRQSAGVVAQEVEAVLPEAVKDANERLSVAPMAVIGLLVEAVKELRADVNNLRKEIHGTAN